MTSVLLRIQRKIDVLQAWANAGLPSASSGAGQVWFPTSLTKARLWEDSELGLEKIADPASFTKHHPRHGSKVVEIEALIKRLRAMQARPRPIGKSLSARLEGLRQTHNLLAERHRKVVSQLAAALEELEKERSQRLAVERALAQQRSRERAEIDRAGGSPLSIVPIDDGE